MYKHFILLLSIILLTSACKVPTTETESGEAEQPIGINSEAVPETTPLIIDTSNEETAGDDKTLPEDNLELMDFTDYFQGFNGCAVFYSPTDSWWWVYNETLSEIESSPCSTFKIISSLIGLESGVIESLDTMRQWNGTTFWNAKWNQDISFKDAFASSCVWYFREVIDEIGEEEMLHFLTELDYGNRDISDWEGLLNKNNAYMELRGFWIESSLKISPKQQAEVMKGIFAEDSPYSSNNLDILKEVMFQPESTEHLQIYGKTGMGMADGKCIDAWFAGMFVIAENPVYFSLRLDDPDNGDTSSTKAREIAIDIIQNYFGQE